MAILTRDQIIACQDIKTEEVQVPEWGGSVLVRGLTGEERDAYEATLMQLRGTDAKLNLANARAKLVARSVVDDAGNLLFSDRDVAQLAKKGAAALQHIFDVAQRLSGLTKSDLDDLTKNSEDGQHDALPID